MSTVQRSLFRVRYRTIILLMVVAIILWSGFSYWAEYSEHAARRARELLAPPLGVPCRINLIGEEATPLSGRIIDQSERWIVMQPAQNSSTSNVAAQVVWIPRERVMLIEISD